jgi:hypothetical protein
MAQAQLWKSPMKADKKSFDIDHQSNGGQSAVIVGGSRATLIT